MHGKRRKRIRQQLKLSALLFVLCLLLASIVYLHSNEAANPEEKENVESVSIEDPSTPVFPDYYGVDVVELNGGNPYFTSYDLENTVGETYSELDDLGRCGKAAAMLDASMMPEGPRKSISDVRPSGWMQKKYPGIVESDPPYLYNRCHLIAYGLTGQNANELNLITGTRYMNAETMLAYEEQVMHYLYHSDNHVLYRISPYFKDSELVARGVEMEAYSVEDEGRGICFHVFVYNVQPGIGIDYQTGNSWIKEPGAPEDT